MRNDDGVNLLCFAIGLTLGVAVGLVLAPQPGSVTRRQAFNLYERGVLLAEELYEEGEGVMEAGHAQA